MEQRMISYTKGITRNPGELMAEDGELLECINLKCEDGELKPMLWPEPAGITLNDGEELLYVHKGNGYKNYFVGTKEADDQSGITVGSFYMNGSGERVDYTFSHVFSGALKFEAIGNTLVVSDGEGIHYVLYKNKDYKYLGQKPPMVKLRFGLRGPKPDGYERYERFAVKTSRYKWPSASGPTYTDKDNYLYITDNISGPASDSLMADINTLHTSIKEKGQFAFPFLVRYAYRLFDGTYIYQSIPVLMTPSSHLNPLLNCIDLFNESGVSRTDVMMLCGKLQYTVVSDAETVSALQDWSDIVKSVDIAVTKEVPTYDQSGKINKIVPYTLDEPSISEGDSPETAFRTYIKSSYFLGNPAPTDYDDGNYLQRYTLNDWYALYNTKVLGNESTDIAVGASVWILPYRSKSWINKQIKDLSIFYKVSSINLSSIESPTDDTYILHDVNILENTLTTLETQERLPDGYRNFNRLKADSIYSFNGRLNLAGVTEYLTDKFDVGDLSCLNGEKSYNTKLYVDVETEFGKKVIENSNTIKKFDADNFPTYIFYPDDRATFVDIELDGKYYYPNGITLDNHIGLNGTVRFDGFEPDTYEELHKFKFPSADLSVPLSNKIYTSEVNNPFVFSPGGVNTVGTGDVLGIVSTTKALSQGQFGQFPLLVLTTDGVWALTVNDEGLYSTTQVISREVCNNADSIVQTDDAVYFTTEKGLTVIAGSDVALVSGHMRGLPSMVGNLSRMDDILSMMPDAATLVSACDDDKTFSDFLRGCKAGYNYRDGSIFMSNEEYDYLYVYQISNRSFSKLMKDGERVNGFVNDYPDTLMRSGGGVWSLLKEHPLDGEASSGFAMTRAMKLGNPAGMKKVRQLKNVASMTSSESYVKYALWGSNDGLNWYYVGSYTGGFKYYRMGLFTWLKPSESLLGTVMLTEEKRKDKLR